MCNYAKTFCKVRELLRRRENNDFIALVASLASIKPRNNFLTCLCNFNLLLDYKISHDSRESFKVKLLIQTQQYSFSIWPIML